MAFNNPNLIGPNLIKAIKDGDRAAAWYEIAFNSNLIKNDNQNEIHGIQNRRKKEADNFGLYTNKLEAKEALKLLISKERDITKKYSTATDKRVKIQINEYLTKHLNELAGIADAKNLQNFKSDLNINNELFQKDIFKCKDTISEYYDKLRI